MDDVLNGYLDRLSGEGGDAPAVAAVIAALARAAAELHAAIRNGTAPTGGGGQANASGEVQKPLDLLADELFLRALQSAPLHCYASEEQEQPIVMGRGPLALAIDPLDGSSNIETNIAVGTIFSLLPVLPEHGGRPERIFAQAGHAQRAAGFFVYGAQLLLILTCGAGTECFVFDPAIGKYGRRMSCRIPAQACEYSINAANRRHWPRPLQRYLRGLELGGAGPRGRDFGMRYAGSLVADGYRILQRGGIFLYPADARDSHSSGRLRQLYEANPIAFCIEQAGGAATDGIGRMLDRPQDDLHGKVPLIFGSRDEVEIATRHLAEGTAAATAAE